MINCVLVIWKLIKEAIIISLIQRFETDFPYKVLNSGLILKTFTHVCVGEIARSLEQFHVVCETWLRQRWMTVLQLVLVPCCFPSSGSTISGWLVHKAQAWWQDIREVLCPCLAEVLENGVDLLASIHSSCKVVECQNKLVLTGTPLVKSVLLDGQDGMRLKVFHYLAMQDMFQLNSQRWVCN